MRFSPLTVSLSLAAHLLMFSSLLLPAHARDSNLSHEQDFSQQKHYRLGPNDTIKIQVQGEDDLSTEVRVGGGGRIAMPLLGIIEVQGLTVRETEELITTRLADGYLKNPLVNIYIMRYRNFYIAGEVRSPGGYPYVDGLTVFKAVTLAGGLTDKASTSRIKIKRPKGGEEVTVSVELEDLVFPDDVIIVPQSFF